MEILSCIAYLLIIKNKDGIFGIIKLQTNNILNIKIEAFINKEEAEIIKAKFKAKSQTILETSTSEDFNHYHITNKDKSIIVV